MNFYSFLLLSIQLFWWFDATLDQKFKLLNTFFYVNSKRKRFQKSSNHINIINEIFLNSPEINYLITKSQSKLQQTKKRKQKIQTFFIICHLSQTWSVSMFFSVAIFEHWTFTIQTLKHFEAHKNIGQHNWHLDELN